MVVISSSKLIAARFILSPIRLPVNFLLKPPKTLDSVTKMASWACVKCTYINPPTQKSNCEICLSAPPQSLQSSAAPSSLAESKWACASCTFLNPYRSTNCEICGTRASASLLSTLEVDFNDPEEAQLGASVGSVFFPLQSCRNNKKINTEKSGASGGDAGSSGKLKGIMAPSCGGDSGNLGALRPCSNKRKNRESCGADGGGRDSGASCGLGALKDANMAGEVQTSDETHMSSKSRIWKFMSYNIWFREDVEMHNRMKALGNLIRQHSPDVICLQEVTPIFYEIFRQTNWWKEYQCSISDKTAIPGAYFCMQLSKLPVKSYFCRPFYNSIMGRELCVAEVNAQPDLPIIVATSHLESPCPAPPTWNQMLSKERVEQANETVTFLDKNQNIIFCGDMNWDDKLDGPFPLPDGWVDAWTDLRPGEEGWTYDTKSNKMLTGNRTLQKRLDRFICKLKDFKLAEIEMIGKDAIPGLSYVKEKKVKGQVKELELPVLPSDHYGLLLTISTSGNTTP